MAHWSRPQNRTQLELTRILSPAPPRWIPTRMSTSPRPSSLQLSPSAVPPPPPKSRPATLPSARPKSSPMPRRTPYSTLFPPSPALATSPRATPSSRAARISRRPKVLPEEDPSRHSVSLHPSSKPSSSADSLLPPLSSAWHSPVSSAARRRSSQDARWSSRGTTSAWLERDRAKRSATSSPSSPSS